MSGGNLLLLPGGHTWVCPYVCGIVYVLSCGDVGMQNREFTVLCQS